MKCDVSLKDTGLCHPSAEPFCSILLLPKHMIVEVEQVLSSVQVHLLVRSGKMRASAAMQDRVLNHEKVEVHFNTGVADAYGDKKGLKGLHLTDTSTGAPTFSRGFWCQMKCPEDALR